MSDRASFMINCWSSARHALAYLERADAIPHRAEGERALLEYLPPGLHRILDLGTGDGRLLSLVTLQHPAATGVALDFSDTMIERASQRFAADPAIRVVRHDLSTPLPDVGQFDAVVSSFAIHHLAHERKRALFAEVFRLLAPAGVFCNLEHVASPTPALHIRFLAALGIRPEQEDASNKLLDVETQLAWLREIGFSEVDCHWKWMELALLIATRPVEKTLAPPRNQK